MSRFKYFFATRKGKIEEFYREAIKRVSEIKDLEAEGKSSMDNLDDWAERYHKMTEQARKRYDDNEKRLEELIYPIMDGRIPMTQRLAHILIQEIRKAREAHCYDSLITMEMLTVILRFYEDHPAKNVEDQILALCLAGNFENIYGIDEHFRKAVEYCTMAISYSPQFKTIKDGEAKRRLFDAFYFRMASETYKMRCDVAALYEYYKDALSFYDDPENRKAADFPFEERVASCRMIMNYQALSRSRKNLNCLVGFMNESADEAVVVYEREARKGDGERFFNPLIKLNYALASVYKNWMTPAEAYSFLVEEARKIDSEINYEDDSFYSEDLYCYTLFWAPEIMILLEESGYPLVRVREIRNEVASKVFKIYAAIPYNKRSHVTNTFIHFAYKYVLPYFEINEKNLDLLMKATMSKRNTMAIHSHLVMLLSTEVVKTIIQDKPELFIGTMKLKDEEDVKLHTEEILSFMKKAAFCHDIGKIVFEDIVNIQYRKTTATETELLRMHPRIGALLIDNIPELKIFYDITMGHHKSYDGASGYPEGYDNRSSEWGFVTDIIHICDALDAATDTYGRIYKESKTYVEIREELLRGRCSEYNPEVVDIILGNERLSKTLEFIIQQGREVYLYLVSATLDQTAEP